MRASTTPSAAFEFRRSSSGTSRSRLALYIAAVCAMTGCHMTGLGTHRVRSAYSSTVPAEAPDTSPQALFDSLEIIRSEDGHGPPAVRGIVVIQFKDNVNQPERQATVDGIRGVVVGGSRLIPFSFYYVLIPGRSYADIMKACEATALRPSVFSAFPMSTDGVTFRSTRVPRS